MLALTTRSSERRTTSGPVISLAASRWRRASVNSRCLAMTPGEQVARARRCQGEAEMRRQAGTRASARQADRLACVRSRRSSGTRSRRAARRRGGGPRSVGRAGPAPLAGCGRVVHGPVRGHVSTRRRRPSLAVTWHSAPLAGDGNPHVETPRRAGNRSAVSRGKGASSGASKARGKPWGAHPRIAPGRTWPAASAARSKSTVTTPNPRGRRHLRGRPGSLHGTSRVIGGAAAKEASLHQTGSSGDLAPFDTVALRGERQLTPLPRRWQLRDGPPRQRGGTTHHQHHCQRVCRSIALYAPVHRLAR